MRVIISWILLVFGQWTAISQSEGYVHFGIEDGLLSNLIYFIEEGREGYMWFGTDKGLSRFDGMGFKNYDMEDGLPNPEVLSMYEDGQGRLWISCFGQKPAYRLEGKFYNEKNNQQLANISSSEGHEYLIFEDRDSTLWIFNGFNTYHSSFGSQIIEKIEKRTLGIHSLHQVGPLYLFFNRGIHSYDTTINTSTLLYPINPSLLWCHSFTVNGNHVLYSFRDEIHLLKYKGKRIEEATKASYTFKSVYTDRSGRFWGSYPNKGAICFDNQQKDFSNPTQHLPDKKVSRVYEDLRGNFWFATLGEGVFLLPKNHSLSWRKEHGLPSSNILSLATLPDGTVLAGDDSGNVLFFNDNQLEHIETFSSEGKMNFVRQILPIDGQAFWAVTDRGVFLKNDSGATRLGLGITAPKGMTKRGKEYWFGTNTKIGNWDIDEAKLSFFKLGRVTDLATDSEGYIWKGATFGLFGESDGFEKNRGDQFPLLKSYIVAIQPYLDNHLLAATPAHGLLMIKVSAGEVVAVEQVNERLEHPIKNIKKIHVTEEGDIWLATNQGAFKIDREWNVTNYSSRQGLASNDVNDVLVLNDTLWAATANGISILSVQEEATEFTFQTVLQEVRYQSHNKAKMLDFSGKSHLPLHAQLPKEAQLPSAHFAGLQLPFGHDLYYQHIQERTLLPFPHYTFNNLLDWVGLGSTDTILVKKPDLHFGTTLQPGRYLLTSTAITAKGQEGQPVEWEMDMPPRWTQTIWPWLTLVAFVAGGLWRAYRLRTAYLRMENAVSQVRLQALRVQINPHFVGNSINAIQKFFYPPDPEKASEYIYLFTVLLRKTLHLSEKDFIPFSQELEYNRQYLEMIELRYAGQFEYEITGAEDISFELLFPPMFLQPILENATVHGLAEKGVSILKLHFQMDNSRLTCVVTDNGTGINEAKRRKKLRGTKHKSKGTELLQTKAKILNRLHGLDMKLEWADLFDLTGGQANGTQVTISFAPKIKKP